MDDSAIAKIKAEVSASVTKTYAETIFTSIGTMSDGFAGSQRWYSTII